MFDAQLRGRRKERKDRRDTATDKVTRKDQRATRDPIGDRAPTSRKATLETVLRATAIPSCSGDAPSARSWKGIATP